MARFAAVPDVPEGLESQPLVYIMDAIKQNVELLTGLRGEDDGSSRAILRGQIRVSGTPTPLFTGLEPPRATGAGYTVSGVDVASHEDYVKLIGDYVALYTGVVRLAQDVAGLRSAIDTLLNQMRGS